MKNNNLFFLIDAYYLIFRAYYTFINYPKYNSSRFNTSVILGFVNSLINILNTYHPKYISIIFDKSNNNSFRHKLYNNYKSNRKKTPELIILSLPYIYKILTSFNINYIYIEDYEADDIIASLSNKFSLLDVNIYIVTADKDLLQLVSKNIKICKPNKQGSFDIIGVQEVCNKYNIKHPLEIIDLFAMVGDVSDNIPGIPGIGFKSAAKCIMQYGSIENIINNIDDLKGKIQFNIHKYQHLGLMSKKLFSLKKNLPVNLELENFIIKSPDYDNIKQIFKDLDFHNLLIRTLNFFTYYHADLKLDVLHNKKDSLHCNGVVICQLVDSNISKLLFRKILLLQNTVSFYIDYSVINNIYYINSISFSFNKYTSYYFLYNYTNNSIHNIKIYLQELNYFFTNHVIIKVSYNIKLMIKILFSYGIILKEPFYDVMIVHHVLKNNDNYHLKHIIDNYFNNSLIFNFYPYKILSKNNKIGIQYSNYIFNIKHILDKLIKKYNLDFTIYNIEMPLIMVLFNIEKQGVMCDRKQLLSLSAEYDQNIENIKNKIYKYSNYIFNIDSYKVLGDILFNKLKINYVNKVSYKTKKGLYVTSINILNKYIKEHPVIKYIITYRKLKKIKNSYIDIFIKYLEYDNKIYTCLDQVSSSTGRIISTNPNLQNIPIRDDLYAKKIRKIFISDNDDFYVISADYSQIELRLIAHFSKDLKLNYLFNSNQDVHAIIASEIFNINLSNVTKKDRYIAKIINFGILYGISPYGLSKSINISLNQAKLIINNYYHTYHQLKEYIDRQIQLAKTRNYVTTLFGRNFFIPNIRSTNHVLRKKAERNIINTPIQGSVAELVKLTMIKLSSIFKKQKYKSRIIINIHDELIFNVYKKEQDVVKKIIKNIMENIITISIPLKINIGIGTNWGNLYYHDDL